MTIVESTTGNAGIACSAVAAIKARLRDRDARGHEQRTQADDRGLRRRARPDTRRRHRYRPRDRKMREIVGADPERYFVPGVREPRQPRCAGDLGEEIWQQSGGQVDAVVAAQGTGGWITGSLGR